MTATNSARIPASSRCRARPASLRSKARLNARGVPQLSALRLVTRSCHLNRSVREGSCPLKPLQGFGSGTTTAQTILAFRAKGCFGKSKRTDRTSCTSVFHLLMFANLIKCSMTATRPFLTYMPAAELTTQARSVASVLLAIPKSMVIASFVRRKEMRGSQRWSVWECC